MASPPLVNTLVEKSPTKVDQQDRGMALEEPKHWPAATRRNEQPSEVVPNANSPVKLSPWPRQRRALPDAGHHPSRSPSALFRGLVRGLAATKRFIFAENKNLHEGYVPNYRCASSVPPHPVPFV
jgi:hypothetical protein